MTVTDRADRSYAAGVALIAIVWQTLPTVVG